MVAGAMSMAAGEYVSVSSQADTEAADLARERQELVDDAAAELAELTGIYVQRGLDPELARQVAVQLTRHDALGAHARDELGITDALAARPVQAAFTSAAMFSLGAALPLGTASVLPASRITVVVSFTSLLFLALLGGLSAHTGGARVGTAVLRVTFWGALAMAATAGIGMVLGVTP
jgi:VIT1/CCC1 family predicted Fe2+/Mn2+ transporter